MRILQGAQRRARRLLLLTGTVLLAAALIAAEPAAAQTNPTTDCQCVDPAGNVIEECVCFQTPSRDDLWASLPFPRRAVVGVSIDYQQEAAADAVGAEMLEVLEGGPAEGAGMRAGDIVTHVQGRSVFDPLSAARERQLSESESLPVQRFVQLIGGLEPGEPVEIRYLRDGQPRTATVTPEQATAAPLDMWGEPLRLQLREFGNLTTPDRVTIRTVPPTRAEGTLFVPFSRNDPCLTLDDGGRTIRLWGATNCVAGVEFVELTPGLGEYFGTERGVLVAEVADDSPLGLRSGDVLMAIDGRTVESVATARRILASYVADEELRLRVMRQGSVTEILGRMP